MVETRPLDRLLAIMARLRDPQNGCEWDRVQTFATIAPYTIEEAYEVADAIARDDLVALREELGDLLLQVVFHARMAQEAGAFDFDAVAQAIGDKLVNRHPHLFGTQAGEPASQTERWERIKEDERKAKGEASAMDGVALALPALMRAEKLQKRAARLGFDWPDTAGARAKIEEELAELENARTGQERLEEAGDLLFAAVNVVRHYDVAPEDALAAANAKFERRFRAMENSAARQGEDFAALDLDAMEQHWAAAKRSERAKPS